MPPGRVQFKRVLSGVRRNLALLRLSRMRVFAYSAAHGKSIFATRVEYLYFAVLFLIIALFLANSGAFLIAFLG